jgi:hypothetical protein
VIGDDFRGAKLTVREFWILVNILPPCDDLRLNFLRQLVNSIVSIATLVSLPARGMWRDLRVFVDVDAGHARVSSNV